MNFNINGWEALVIIILIISMYNLIKEIIIAIVYNNIVKKMPSDLSKEKWEEALSKQFPPLPEETKQKPNKTKKVKKDEE